MTQEERIMQAKKIRLMKIALVIGCFAMALILYLLVDIDYNTTPKPIPIYHTDALGI